MMHLNGLTLFGKTSAERSWILASWHSRHSLTWRWSLCLRVGEHRGCRFGVHPYRTNDGLQWVAGVKGMSIAFSQQRPMWYRDLYNRAYEQRERLEREVVTLSTRSAARPMTGPPPGTFLN